MKGKTVYVIEIADHVIRGDVAVEIFGKKKAALKYAVKHISYDIEKEIERAERDQAADDADDSGSLGPDEPDDTLDVLKGARAAIMKGDFARAIKLWNKADDMGNFDDSTDSVRF